MCIHVVAISYSVLGKLFFVEVLAACSADGQAGDSLAIVTQLLRAMIISSQAGIESKSKDAVCYLVPSIYKALHSKDFYGILLDG